jgi:phage terminase large subunit-like protein
MCRGCHVVAFFGGVLFAPKNLVLLPWQEQELRTIYGTVDVETGQRRYWKAYEEVPKKNGKSFLVGGMPLYHLTYEDVERPHAYGCASAKDQAGIVYASATFLCQDNEILRDRLKILESTKRIIRRDGAGFYAVLSADGDLQDGIEPSLGIFDELHRYKTAKAKTLFDVVTKGTISRDESLIVEITTAGDAKESPICYKEHQRAKRILSGQEPGGRMHARIFSADADRIKDDPEYWKSREARVQANPSHEDRGGFLKDEKIVEEIENGESEYKRYHLNIWGQAADRWLKSGEWARGNQETRSLLRRRCYIGIDLSSTEDFTAVVLVFPDDSDGSYDIMPFLFVPKDRAPSLETQLHVPLAVWIKQDLVTATEGDVVDYDIVEDKIKWAVDDFDVQEICYDPWNATDLINRLTKSGHNCVKISQRTTDLTAAMKHIKRKLLAGKIRHGGHEALAWHAECVSTWTDRAGNIAPKKPDLAKDAFRIDGFAGMLTAMVRGMMNDEVEGSVYDNPETAVM